MKVTSLIRNIINKNKEITGYEIFKILKSKTEHSHQQVYRELNTLCKNGEISYTERPQTGRPDKKVYKPHKIQRLGDAVKRTNFRKKSMAYKILDEDLKNGTNNFDKYVEVMEETERRLAKLFGVE